MNMTAFPTAAALLDEIYKTGEVQTADGRTLKPTRTQAWIETKGNSFMI